MEIKVFTEIIREELKKRTGLEVKAQEVRKNNNVILHGINIMEKDSNISPVIYMESYHEAYEQGAELSEIAEQIYQVHQREKLDDTFDVKWFREWENVKGQVAYKLINYVENVELLETIPHERFLDLVKVYYVSVDCEKLGKGTILIHNSHLDMWGISAEQLRLVADEKYMEKSTRNHRPKQLVRKKVAQGIHPVLSACISRQSRSFLVVTIIEMEEKCMLLNGMEVIQRNGLYYIFTQYGELKSIHYLPDDGQLMADFKVMDHITKATALRWGIISPKKKNS